MLLIDRQSIEKNRRCLIVAKSNAATIKLILAYGNYKSRRVLQINNKLAPYTLKNFDKMIKAYVISLLVSIFLLFMSDGKLQKERMTILIISVSILVIMVLIGKKIFTSKINEKLGLYLLYLSTLLFPVSFLLLNFAVKLSITLKDLVFHISIMLLISLLLVNLVMARKYGKKYFSDTILNYIVFVPIFLVVAIPLIANSDDMTTTFIGLGASMECVFATQYPRIAKFFEQNEIDRYGKSLDILSKIKEKDKK